ncbi:MAG: YgiQ family radical SAM protein [Firmicutes bacterium]|nr:YgiQ family radical SAM protein [Bacillota bacterium]
MTFLPYDKKTMAAQHWDAPDFVLVTGDAYVDHPSFGAAIIGRVLEQSGFRVAVLSQPKCSKTEAFMTFGRPNLGFLVTSGNIDSMVAHYTVNKRRRHDDKYTPGNKSGRRPDRAVTVYCRKIREAYGDIPIIIGGIEASLRRLAHYDYWDNKVLPSILDDSTADLLVYGMGERSIREIALRLNEGEYIGAISDVRGTAYRTTEDCLPSQYELLPSYKKVCGDKKAFAEMTKLMMDHADHVHGKTLVQKGRGDLYVVQNMPSEPLNRRELDEVYDLPFTYRYPEVYDRVGGVKAMEEVEFSLTHNRGCFGSCNFCSIALHQGRYVVGRSHESVLKEAKKMTAMPNFKGYIHDVGGATANFRGPACEKQEKKGLCAHKKCLYPEVCPSIRADHSDYLKLLRELRALPKVKRVFIRSGIRYDYVLADKKQEFLQELVKYHVSGQLRIAPEHVSPNVLKRMGKPSIDQYERFSKAFYKATEKEGKEQYVLPYLISSHPGSTLDDAVELAVWLKKHRLRLEQVQDFYPTPATVSTCMYYTGIDPLTMEKVYVPRSADEKKMQRALMQSYKKENAPIVRKALEKAGRHDLINGKNSLLPAVQKPNRTQRKH